MPPRQTICKTSATDQERFDADSDPDTPWYIDAYLDSNFT